MKIVEIDATGRETEKVIEDIFQEVERHSSWLYVVYWPNEDLVQLKMYDVNKED